MGLDAPNTNVLKVHLQEARIKILDRIKVLTVHSAEMQRLKLEDREDFIKKLQKERDDRALQQSVLDSVERDIQRDAGNATQSTPPVQRVSFQTPPPQVPVTSAQTGPSFEESTGDESQDEQQSPGGRSQGAPRRQGAPGSTVEIEDSTDEDSDDISHGTRLGPRPASRQRGTPRDELSRLRQEIDYLRNRDLRKKAAPMKVGAFAGDRLDYPRFKTAFKLANENTDLDSGALAVRLGECLKGEPHKKYGHIAAEAKPGAYKRIWRLLDTFYGPKEGEHLEKIEKFIRMPDIKALNANTAQSIYSMLEYYWPTLKEVLKDDFGRENNYIFRQFLKKMPHAELRRYKDLCESRNERETFRTFKKWILREYMRLMDDKDQNKVKGPTDMYFQMWEDGREPIAAPTFFKQEIHDSPGSDVTLGYQHCNISEDEDGTPYATLTTKTLRGGSLCFVADGKYTKIDNIKLPAETFQKAYERVYLEQTKKNKKGNNVTFKRPALEHHNPSTRKDGKAQAAPCHCCGSKDHVIYMCDKFIGLPLKQKLAIVKDKQLCFRCLNSKHLARDCKVKFYCDVDRCGKRHHRLLHPDKDKVSKTYFQMIGQQGIGSDISDSESED
jgi:hypothetical protein